jgi:hypothetical protein
MYLHYCCVKIVFLDPFTYALNTLNFSDSVRQDGKAETPEELQVGAEQRQYCWEQHSKGTARKTIGEVLVHADTLPRLRDISGKFNYRLHPLKIASPSP